MTHRIFYGWYLVGVAFITSAMSTGIQAYTLGVFLRPMAEQFDWSRTMVSVSHTVGIVTSALCTPLVGPLIDRYGGRVIMVGGALISGAALMGLGLVRSLWHFYVLRGFLFSFGHVGTASLVTTVTLSNWFVRQRGRAVAIGMMGVSVSAMVLPPMCQWIITAYGWPMAWVVLGLATWGLIIPPAAIFMRRRPEDMGLHPDGDPIALDPTCPLVQRRSVEAIKTDQAIWTRRAAVHTRALWLLVGAFGCAGMALTGMMLHLIPFLQDMGYSPTVAAGSMTAWGLAGFLVKPLWGLLIDRVPVRLCAIGEFGLCGSGIGAILVASRTGRWELVYAAVFVFGLGVGGVLTVSEVVWANYFGRLTLGTVRSIAVPFQISLNAFGPLLAGVAYDITHSYRGAFFVFMGTYALASLLIACTTPPVPPEVTAARMP